MISIQEIIRNRRSIYPKMFTGEIIDDEDINQILESANWAPTHKFTEPWRFTVFKGEGLKILADFQSNLYKEVSQKNGTFDQIKFEKLQQNPLKCSHVIGIGVKINGQLPEIEETNATASAVQNMLLTISELKLGCYWGSGGITYLEEAKPFFDLEPNDIFMGFLFLGKFSGQWPKGRRKPISDKVKWVTK